MEEKADINDIDCDSQTSQPEELLPTSVNLRRRSDSELGSVLEDCSNYIILQDKIKKNLSSGFFQLAKCRKSLSLDPSGFREDMTSAVRVELTINDQLRGRGEWEEWKKKQLIDPLLLVHGMPNPALKLSQS